ncbi:MAG TPA: NADH:flavin oxidoreductase [Candidatus Obscuribacterales bacterium]
MTISDRQKQLLEQGLPAESSREQPLDVSPLFRSFKFGRTVLKNRIVMAPMTRGKSPGGIPTGDVARYYARRALGGVGLIITEGTHMRHESAQGYPDVPFLAGEEALEGWRKVVHYVHAAGCPIIPQLWHVGSYLRPGFDRGRRIPRLAPSAVAHPGLAGLSSENVPKRMTDADIEKAIDSFVEASLNARQIGFDGVEIHGAHGYLIDQFFWRLTNKRLDRFGGSWRDRSRFAAELVAAVRKAVGTDFPIVFRFSNWKLNVYDERGRLANRPKELEQILSPLVAAGVDIFHASTRRLDTAEFAGSDLNLAGWTKKITGLPAISVGSVGLTTDMIAERQGEAVANAALDRLIERLRNEEFDLVAVGRALLGDPNWCDKVRHGAFSEIMPYNRACLDRLL